MNAVYSDITSSIMKKQLISMSCKLNGSSKSHPIFSGLWKMIRAKKHEKINEFFSGEHEEITVFIDFFKCVGAQICIP